jgi:predicted RNA-binding Zn ribbon-like protein
LVNTEQGGHDQLSSITDLDAFLIENPFTGVHKRTRPELNAVRALRSRLRSVWDSPDEATTVQIVNDLLREAKALPYLTKHDDWDWHLHVTEPEASLAHRMGAEAAMAFVDLVRTNDLDRLRHCAADDCDAVLVDLSRNKSRRYCSTGNCGNRMNVAAYRARRTHP